MAHPPMHLEAGEEAFWAGRSARSGGCARCDMRREVHVIICCLRRRRLQRSVGGGCGNASIAPPILRRARRPRGHSKRTGGAPLVLLVCISVLGFAVGLQQTRSLLQRSLPPSPPASSQFDVEPRPRTKIKESYARPSRLWASTHPSQPSAKMDTKSPDLQVAPIFAQINEHTELLIQCLHNDDDCTFSAQPIEILRSVMSTYTDWISTDNPTTQQKYKASAAIDKAFRLVTNEAFATPYQLEWVNLGVETLQLQLHSDALAANGNSTVVNGGERAKLIPLEQPYNTIPKGTWLKALRALTSKDISSSRASIRSVKALSPKDGSQWMAPANAAFRVLQRLVRGRGVRTFQNRRRDTQPKQSSLDERDFNMVLHAFARTLNQSSMAGPEYNMQMYKMHSVMALQERTPHAPPLSPVAYSILLKAYGQFRDIKNVEMSIRHAQRNGVVPDIVMANTVLDAFVNCGQLQRARDVMHSMTSTARESEDAFWSLLKPNSRTYNTLLKGMAEEGDLRSAMKLSKVVQTEGLWDDVTTNTLVKAAVTSQDFVMAETILSDHTTTKHSRRRADHPNVEAYTELIDGYAKDGQLESALRVMQLMQQRKVDPNEYTYTCIVGALARNNKVRQARKMMTYAAGLPAYKGRERVLTPIFNAFISGLMSSEGSGQSHAANIVEVLAVLEEMQEMGIHPNAVTVALVVDGLGRCNPPRCKEARELVQHLEFTSKIKQRNSGFSSEQGERGASTGISLSNNKIATALIRSYGLADDVDSALELYASLPTPDVVAFNALLDACCRCDRLQLALEMFKKLATSDAETPGRTAGDVKRTSMKTDVVTYTTLISALLQLKSRAATKRASALFKEMKEKWWISPDTILVDTILTGMISGGPIGFQDDDVKFTLEVLRDGARLEWEPGQYEKRKRAVRGILVGCSSEVWKQDAFAFGLVSEQPEDPLFAKKGWNTIDSGFRLWGGGGDDLQQPEGDGATVDSFLASKGWNDIDSGFRLL